MRLNGAPHDCETENRQEDFHEHGQKNEEDQRQAEGQPRRNPAVTIKLEVTIMNISKNDVMTFLAAVASILNIIINWLR